MGARRIFYEIPDLNESIEALIALGDRSRQDGAAVLEHAYRKLNPANPFDRLVRIGLALIIDGVDPELVSRTLEHYSESYLTRLHYRWRIWDGLLGECYSGQRADTLREYLYAILLHDHPENSLLLTAFGDLITELADENGHIDSARWPAEYLEHPLTSSTLRVASLRGRIPEERLRRALDNQFASYKDLFVKMSNIAIEGVISLQSGDNPRLMRNLLATLEGNDILQVRTLAEDQGLEFAEDESLSVLHHNDPESPENLFALTFEETFLNLDFKAIRRVMREVEPQELARALAGVREEVREIILSNVSDRTADRLRRDAGSGARASRHEVRRAQERILGVFQRLREAGEIAFSDPDESL